MASTILVTGGAGYIGSHAAFLLSQQQNKVIILDTLNHQQTFNHKMATLIKEDFANESVLEKIFTTHKIDAVMHFAAYIEVGESVKEPLRFYDNNVTKTLTLLKMMLKHNVKNFIFSSSCAVYGEPKYTPLDENHPCTPISPYGKNKLIIEFALQDYARAYGLGYVALRYFNAAGALPDARLGEQHNPETHIIPLMLQAIYNNKPFKIFGNDYATPDGTCIRDYIHVLDIAQAHIDAFNYLNAKNPPTAINLGSGKGFSVNQMIKECEQIVGKKMLIQFEQRRAGDPAILLANPIKAETLLGWKPKHSDIKTIIESAHKWHSRPLTGAENFSRVHPCESST